MTNNQRVRLAKFVGSLIYDDSPTVRVYCDVDNEWFAIVFHPDGMPEPLIVDTSQGLVSYQYYHHRDGEVRDDLLANSEDVAKLDQYLVSTANRLMPEMVALLAEVS